MVFSGGDLQKRGFSLIMTTAVTSALTFILVLILVVFFFDKRQATIGVGQARQTNSLLPESSRGETVTITGGDEEVGELIKKVSRHVFLPGGKVTATTVVDPEGLRTTTDAKFYSNAKKGDKVLFYADRAVLYDPTIDLVLDMAYVLPVKTN